MLFAVIALLALTRAEIVARMKAPVLTMSEGLVQVYADCPEDMRLEYQMPTARFAADMVEKLYRGSGIRPRRFVSPGIIVHIGSVRTNLAEVVTSVRTNGERVVTRLYARSPRYVDVDRLGIEISKAFHRAVRGMEVDDASAIAALRAADPRARVENARGELEEWLRGEGGHDDEEALALMRKVIEPGHASRRDILVFASRMRLYPATFDRPFAGRYDCLSFRDAIAVAKIDPCVRFAALSKANELPVFGGGRGELLANAAEAHSLFLRELARGKKDEAELSEMLDEAESRLIRALGESDGGSQEL